MEHEERIEALERQVQELRDEISIAKGLFETIGLHWEPKIPNTFSFQGRQVTVSTVTGVTGGGGGGSSG